MSGDDSKPRTLFKKVPQYSDGGFYLFFNPFLFLLLQAFPHMRSDNGLIQFNRQLKRCGYDLDAWRQVVLTRPTADISHGFEILDLDNGLGWDLVRAMVRYKARKRISANGALGHPFFTTSGILAVQGLAELRCALGNSFRADTDEWGQWIFDMMAKSGTEKEGGFTEAQLFDIRVRASARRDFLLVCRVWTDLVSFNLSGFLRHICVYNICSGAVQYCLSMCGVCLKPVGTLASILVVNLLPQR